MKYAITLLLLFPLFGWGQMFNSDNCGTWKANEPVYTEWETTDTIGAKVITTSKRNWIEADWVSIWDNWMTLEYAPCGKGTPSKSVQRRVCSLTGIKQERYKIINYTYIPKPKSDYQKVVDSLTPKFVNEVANWGGTGFMSIVAGNGISIDTSLGMITVKSDTPHATIDIQYTRRSVPFTTDVYLINGEPWYKSTAPLTRGKWIKIRCYRYRISEGWIKQTK